MSKIKRRPKKKVVCEKCLKLFEIKASAYPRARFCSKKCQYDRLRENPWIGNKGRGREVL